MAAYTELEECANELAAAARLLAGRGDLPVHFASGHPPNSILPPDAPDHLRRAQRSIIANASKLHLMLGQPVDFLQRLALHNQILACLQWLCEFQVFACIPLDGSVPFKDVADISGVPEAQLCRVARLMATAGFLHEPQPGHVAHSPLSAQFVHHPCLLDAAMFISETAAPTALKMSAATKQFAASDRPDESAYIVAFDTSITLAGSFDQRPKLQRQFAAYLSFATSNADAGVQDVLMRRDWRSLGNATVVDVGAQSTTMVVALATVFPSLRFVVQTLESEPGTPIGGLSMSNYSGRRSSQAMRPRTSCPRVVDVPPQLSSRIILQQRVPAAPQVVKNAAVYLLRLPAPSPSLSLGCIMSRAASELDAHADVLRANPNSRLVLTALILPAPGTVDLEMEARARLCDLSLMQLANGRHADRAEILDTIKRVRDISGRLVLTNEFTSPSTPFVAFEVRYQSYDDQDR